MILSSLKKRGSILTSKLDINLVYDGDSQTYNGYYPTDLSAYIRTHPRYNSLVTYNTGIPARDSGQILAAQANNVLTKYVSGKFNLISLQTAWFSFGWAVPVLYSTYEILSRE